MVSAVWLGTAGIMAMEGSYLPQIFRLFRLKRSEELSLFFPGLNLLGRLFALAYSLITKDHVFTIGFLLGALLRLTLLLQIAWYRRKQASQSTAAVGVPVLGEELAR